ncbi:MAG: hypothetical protein QXV69_10325 [Sulfolobaceae archaeon]
MDELRLLYNNEYGNTILGAIKAIDSEGREYDILPDKISSLLKMRPKRLIVEKALIGELSILKGIAEEVVLFGNSVNNEILLKKEDIMNFLSEIRPIVNPNKLLQIGYKLLNNGIYLGTDTNDGNTVRGIFPFPFRDNCFDGVIIFEILDYEIIREVNRILKRGKRVYLILRDIIKGGADPLQAIKVLSYKFEVIKIIQRKGYWIIEGVKRK